jgi:hypothetical protein
LFDIVVSQVHAVFLGAIVAAVNTAVLDLAVRDHNVHTYLLVPVACVFFLFEVDEDSFAFATLVRGDDGVL